MRDREINAYAALGNGETRAHRAADRHAERIETDAHALAHAARRRFPRDTVRALVWLLCEWRPAPVCVDDGARRELAMDALVQTLDYAEWQVWCLWNRLGQRPRIRARLEQYAEALAEVSARRTHTPREMAA